MNLKLKCYKEGYSANERGIHWTGCPYPYWSDEFEWWHEGYYIANNC